MNQISCCGQKNFGALQHFYSSVVGWVSFRVPECKKSAKFLGSFGCEDQKMAVKIMCMCVSFIRTMHFFLLFLLPFIIFS